MVIESNRIESNGKLASCRYRGSTSRADATRRNQCLQRLVDQSRGEPRVIREYHAVPHFNRKQHTNGLSANATSVQRCVRFGRRDYVHCCCSQEAASALERHLLPRRGARVDADSIARSVVSIVSHVIGEYREVARIDCDAVRSEHCSDLVDDRGARGLDTIRVQHGVNVVARDLVDIDNIVVDPCRVKVHTRSTDHVSLVLLQSRCISE